MESFEELGLSDEVMGAVKEMGISVPTEIQCIAVPAILEGKSVALGSHTGSGKTLAYMLPIVQVIFFLFSLYDLPLFLVLPYHLPFSLDIYTQGSCLFHLAFDMIIFCLPST